MRIIFGIALLFMYSCTPSLCGVYMTDVQMRHGRAIISVFEDGTFRYDVAYAPPIEGTWKRIENRVIFQSDSFLSRVPDTLNIYALLESNCYNWWEISFMSHERYNGNPTYKQTQARYCDIFLVERSKLIPLNDDGTPSSGFTYNKLPSKEQVLRKLKSKNSNFKKGKRSSKCRTL